MKSADVPQFSRLLLLILLAASLAGCAVFPDRKPTPPKDLHVGIWLNRGIMAEGEDAVAAFVEDAAARGITAVYPNVWFHGYTIYPGSEHVDQHPDFRGWNPLEVVVRESSRHGLDVYPWAEYGFFTHVNFTDSQEDTGRILEKHPEWITENREGHLSLYNRTQGFSHYSLNPAHPEARQFLREIMLEAVRLHPDVAGLNLDRIRYQSSNFSYDPFSREQFIDAHGFDPLQISPEREQQARWDRWRVDQINAFIREMGEAFHAEFPEKTLSAAVVPPYMMNEKFQRWDEWLESGDIEVAIPMIYGQLDLVEREIERSIKRAPKRQKLYAGLDLGSMKNQDLLRAIDYARTRGLGGFVLWDDEVFRKRIDLRFGAKE